MWCFLTQLVVLASLRRSGAAGEEDIDRWANILFVVVVGIFWVVGGILKARANKAAAKGETPKGQEEALREKGLKALWEALGLEEPVTEEVSPPSGPVQRRKVVRPQPAERKPAPKKEEAVRIPILETLEVPKAPTLEVPAVSGELPVLAPLGVAGAVEEIPQTEYLGEVLEDYEDPDRLRRAILHYEILGKPLSLREPSA